MLRTSAEFVTCFGVVKYRKIQEKNVRTVLLSRCFIFVNFSIITVELQVNEILAANMKTLIIIFGLLYAANCKPADAEVPDYLDDPQDEDNAAIYDELPPESNTANEKPSTPISISSEPQIFEKHIGDTVVLPCDVNGDDFVQFWKIGGKIFFQSGMAMAAAPNMKQTDNGSLEIVNLGEKDGGDYECEAIVSEQNKAKVSHTLRILTPPQIELLSSKDNQTIFQSGETLILTCKARGYPRPTISWHKGSERFGSVGEVLTIENLKHRDAGQYKCLADNRVGQPTFQDINIKVEYKPIVNIAEYKVSSANNFDIELKCTVHAEPPASVVWQKDGINIKSSKRIELSNKKRDHILLIKGLEDNDFGVYTCMARNSIDTISKNISIVKTPVIVDFKSNELKDQDFELTWKVQSKLKLVGHELQYKKEKDTDWQQVINPEEVTEVNETYAVKYVLKGLGPEMYEARIRSQNANGWSDYSSVQKFQRATAKHGHHKSPKKPHRDGKAKHLQTQEVEKPIEPADHQESVTTKVPPVGAQQASGCSSLTSTLAFLSFAFIVIFHVRLLTIRI